MSGPLGASNAAASAPSLAGLLPALLEFEQRPGRFRLTLREPQLLFAQTHAVLLLAAGRPVAGMAPLAPGFEADSARRAARFFVHTVLLRPDADHYALLGLRPGCGPQALRDHYRLMIRLTHPDFADGGEPWPADAAARINLANDVLGSVVERSRYDATLQAARPGQSMASAVPKPEPRTAPLVLRRTARPARASGALKPLAEPHRRARIWLVTGGALACAVGLWLLTPSHSDGSLAMQRAQPGERAATGNLGASTTPALVNIVQTIPTVEFEPVLLAEPPADKAKPAKAEPPAAGKPAYTPPQAEQAPQPQQIQQAQRPPAARALPAAASNSFDDTRPLALVIETRLALPRQAVTAMAPSAAASADNAPPRAAQAPAPAPPAPAPAPAPAAAAAAEPTPMPAPAAAPASAQTALTVAQVQPTLDKILAGLQTGRGENVVRLLSGDWRAHPAASAFVKRFEQLLAGERVAQVVRSSFSSRRDGAYLVMDGAVELRLEGARGDASRSKSLFVSAYFLNQDGAPLLAQVVAHQMR